jgi:hypothetical protein
VLRLRGVELGLKEDVAKMREQLQSRRDSSHVEQSELSASATTENGSLAVPPETIVIDWEELYQTPPEPACCITAAEETPPPLPLWAMDSSDSSLNQPDMWANGLADVTTSRPNGGSLAAEERAEIYGASLNPEMGVQYILQYDYSLPPFG